MKRGKMSRSFVYTPEHWESEVKRYLFARLDSLWKNLPGNENEILDFLQALTLSPNDIEWLALLYHISRTEGAQQFLVEEAPGKLSSLTRARESRLLRDRKPRGRILWERTIIERRWRRDNQVFVLDCPSKTPNTPENMLLKLYVEEVFNKARSYRGRETEDIRLLSEILVSCEEMLSSTYLKNITTTTEATARMIAQTSRNRRKLYARLHELWVEYEKAILQRDLKAIKEMLAVGWLAPLLKRNTDYLFELFVLVSVINSVEEFVFSRSALTKKSRFGLVRRDGSRLVAIIEGDNWVGEVSFNRSPENLFDVGVTGSLYKTLLNLYNGLSGTSRRPDVAVRIKVRENSKEIRLIVEVKNTEPESSYSSDSLYKAIGYLKDFESIWKMNDQKPKIVLTFPYGISPQYVNAEDWLNQDIAIISGDISTWFLRILNKITVNILR
ncbi:hypothetical protein L7E55_05090 [Pelotomaculum isophthalicicum JI]|uniref:Uncharacterized protein n=1 Tax=Pelotomaculum isophthalicicum JI TaxID=947010 RepID=A0A9X4JVN7_9FIRM|nr:hypothetical protein [Pelotomaculum isophthalicicum]MDF9407738.1 hypothetical protein [Pelotomaculum isophthalicicum JI]